MADTESEVMTSVDTSKSNLDGAIHVFGDVVLDNECEGDELSTSGSFFMYTPSPVKPSDFSASSIAKATKESSNTEPLSDKKSLGGGKEVGSSASNLIVADGQENAQEPNIVNRKSSTTTGLKPSLSPMRFKQRQSKSSLAPDAVHKTQLAIDKAEVDLQAFRDPTRAPLRTKHASRRPTKLALNNSTWDNELQDAKQFYKRMEQKRQEGLRLQRQLSSQASRQKAGFNAMKESSRLQHIEKESQFKSSIYRDHHKTLRENEEKRRRESIAAREKLRRNAREGQERMRMEKIEEDQAVFDDRHATSQAIRETKRSAADRRRQSYQFRNGDAKRIRDLHRRLQEENQAQRHKSAELERMACKDVDDYRKKLKDERRESMANRHIQASQARKEEINYMFETKSKEHESSELERAAAKDAENAQREYNKERRLSEQRHQAKAQQHKKKILAEQEKRMLGNHESHELKRAAAKDVDNYKLELGRERRASYAQRGQDAAQRRKYKMQELSKQAEAEHASFELKRQAFKDGEAYARKQEALRRESFQHRNNEWSRHVKVMGELQQIAQEKETESYVLKWAAENDVKEYLNQVHQKRKESLQARGQEAARIRRQESEEESQQLQKAHDDELARAQDQKDVVSYRRKCAERDRTSLEYRRKEAMKQRLEEAESSTREKQRENSNWELENLAFRDVEDYVKTCKGRKRQSLAFRAKEKRRHAKWREEQKAQERQLTHEVLQGRLVDHRYIEMAKQEERMTAALEAIRHQNRVFSGNAERFEKNQDL